MTEENTPAAGTRRPGSITQSTTRTPPTNIPELYNALSWDARARHVQLTDEMQLLGRRTSKNESDIDVLKGGQEALRRESSAKPLWVIALLIFCLSSADLAVRVYAIRNAPVVRAAPPLAEGKRPDVQLQTPAFYGAPDASSVERQ